jgi:DNA-binding response OmpR family regulator
VNVLLIDDDEDVSNFVLKYLAEVPGLIVDHAQTGNGGLGQAIQQRYDLILLDLHLPDIGGLDILPVLRSCSPRAVIAILSGFVDLVTEEDFAQADAVIAKPVDLDVLKPLIQIVLEIEERRTAIRSLGVAPT